MTSIRDISLRDLALFLSKNNIDIDGNIYDFKEEIYYLAEDLIINSKAEFYPDSIIDWIVAYNFILSGKYIKNFQISEILSLSDDQLIALADLLNLDNTKSIVNVLRYLNKLNIAESIPDEIFLTELLFKLDKKEFVTFCSTNQKFKAMCNDDNFWKKIYQRDIDKFQKVIKYSSYQENYKLGYQLQKIQHLFPKYNIFDLYYETDLELYGENFTVHLPKEIRVLTNLTALSFYDEKIGYVPREIGLLTNLETLNISGNNLQSLPEEIFNLTKLKELDLSYNNLETFPPNISSLTNLEGLEIQENKLTFIPEEIGFLHNLILLNVSGNKLDSLPKEIAFLINLENLDVSYNNLDVLPKNITNLVRLSDFNLSENRLDRLPEEIGKLTNLVTLKVSDNNIKLLPILIGNLLELNYLILSGNQLSSLPKEIGELSKLKILDLSSNNLTLLPDKFTNLSNLQYLDLNYNKFSNVPDQIKYLKLKRIDLKGNNIAEEERKYWKNMLKNY